jgi:hypothetical protein
MAVSVHEMAPDELSIYIYGFKGRNIFSLGKTIFVLPSGLPAERQLPVGIQHLASSHQLTLDEWAACVRQLNEVSRRSWPRAYLTFLPIAGASIDASLAMPMGCHGTLQSSRISDVSA